MAYQQSQPIPVLAEVRKFLKVKVKGQGRWKRYALYWALLVYIITSPTEGDGRLCFRTCHQTLSVIPLTIEDEVIKFWKVNVKGQG